MADAWAAVFSSSTSLGHLVPPLLQALNADLNQQIHDLLTRGGSFGPATRIRPSVSVGTHLAERIHQRLTRWPACFRVIHWNR